MSRTAAIGSAEFDILKSSHRFLRDDNDNDGKDPRSLSWDDRLAKKYYDNLYREFAVCDLKHYKSGNFALRWRTEAEVLSGAGESSCGNTRCPHHTTKTKEHPPQLTTLELPFAYTERGEHKSALVKVVLCGKCLNKLMWKRRKDKERQEEREAAGGNVSPSLAEDGSEHHRSRQISHGADPPVISTNSRTRESVYLDAREDSGATRAHANRDLTGESSSRARDRDQPGRSRNSRSRSPVRRHPDSTECRRRPHPR